ncbi:MAG: hypothetical protein ACYSUY_15125 [Planctomycetota bacterium]|jgi:hypothetical protein
MQSMLKEFINRHEVYLNVALAGLAILVPSFIAIIIYLLSRPRAKIVVGPDYGDSFRHKDLTAFSFGVLNKGNIATSITNATCSFYSNYFTLFFNLPHTQCFASEKDLPLKLVAGETWLWQVNLFPDKHQSYTIKRVSLGRSVQKATIPLTNTTIAMPKNRSSSYFVLRLYIANRRTPVRKLFCLRGPRL